MNEALVTLLFDVVERLEKCIRQHESPAMVSVQGQRTLVITDYDYLPDQPTAAAFEQRAADQARRIAATRWVLAVPQVWVINERDVAVRAVSDHPLRPGEQESITWMAFDRDDGIDYGRVPYARRPNGEPVFDEPEVFTVPLGPGTLMPGHTLLRSFIDDDQASAE